MTARGSIRPRRAVSLLTATALIAGCGTPTHTITGPQAMRRIDAYTGETIRSVPTRLSFAHRTSDLSDNSGCTEPGTGSGFTGQIKPILTYRASTSSIAPAEVHKFSRAVTSYWKKKSASVETSDPGLLTVHPYRDKYRLFMEYYPASHMVEFGGALDECIWPDGTQSSTDSP